MDKARQDARRCSRGKLDIAYVGLDTIDTGIVRIRFGLSDAPIGDKQQLIAVGGDAERHQVKDGRPEADKGE